MIDKELLYISGDHNSEIISFLDKKDSGFEKTAGYSDELKNYIDTLKEEQGKVYALINALSAGEYYGSNRNGDYFPEESLKKFHKTFEEHGNLYLHHQNKNPEKSLGKVVFSHYNDKMHRVEVVVALDTEKAKQIIADHKKGKLIATSMGCKVPVDICLDKDLLIYTKDKIKTLKEIIPGDKVLTHTNSFKKVLATSSRIVNNYIQIEAFGDYLPIKGTHEHPVYVAKKQQFLEGKTIRKKALKDKLPKLEWCELQNLNVGDYLVFNKTLEKSNLDINRLDMRLLGYYLSEGWIIKQRSGRKKKGNYKNMGVGFSFNLNEEFTHVEDLINILIQLNYNYKLYRSINKNELKVIVYSKQIVKFVLEYGGEYSYTKFISPTLFAVPNKLKLELLGTLINGDGSQDHNKHKGTIRYNTVSEQLARGVRRLCLEVGINATVNKRIASTNFSKNITIYTVHIPASFSNLLSKYSSKITSYNIIKGTRFFDYENFILIPIKSIKEKNKILEVCNLQIEEDESYQVLDYISHNCSICNNKAKNRSEYCEHLKTQMNKILPDGRQVYAINKEPKFFDISIVLIPADKTSSVLKLFDSKSAAKKSIEKVAYKDNNDYIIKTAGIVKEVPTETTELVAVNRDPKKLVKKFSKHKIEKLANENFEEVLSTLLGLRIMPHPEDFQKLALYSVNQKEYASYLEDNNICFNTDCEPLDLDLDFSQFNEKIAHLLEDEIYEMSMTKPLFVARELEKIAQEVPPTVLPTNNNWQEPQPPADKSIINKLLFNTTPNPSLSPIKNPIVPLSVIGGMYYGYNKIFNNPAETKFAKVMHDYPWLLPILIGGTAIATAVGQKGFMKKEAGVDKLFTSALIGFPTSYYMAGKYENMAQSGAPISKTQNFIRKHPALMGVLGTLGLHKTRQFLGPRMSKFAEFINRLPEEKLNELYMEVNNGSFN